MNLYVHKKNRLKTSTYSKEISETKAYKLVKKKLRFANDITNKLDVHVFQEVNIHVLLKAMCI